MYTIKSELGKLDGGLTLTAIGDLKHGRTVHSLVQLAALHGMTVNLVSPDSLRMPQHVLDAASERAGGWTAYAHASELTPELLGSTDVLYVTRVQKERFGSEAEYDALKDAFIVSAETMRAAKPSTIVMHPLPRVNEIATDVDEDPRAVYFRQMENGMYVRMALLASVLVEDASSKLPGGGKRTRAR